MKINLEDLDEIEIVVDSSKSVVVIRDPDSERSIKVINTHP